MLYDERRWGRQHHYPEPRPQDPAIIWAFVFLVVSIALGIIAYGAHHTDQTGLRDSMLMLMMFSGSGLTAASSWLLFPPLYKSILRKYRLS